MNYETIRVTQQARIARITLAQPGEGNRVSLRTLRELADACEVVYTGGDAALIVLDAEGPDFCLGWEPAARDHLQTTHDLDPFGCLTAQPLPVLVALHGAVTSAGLELALACDLRVAQDGARFAMPEVLEGQMPLAGATARLPRVVGRTAASAMLLLGDELDSQAAYRCGLVSRVLPQDSFRADVDTLAGRITANGPLGLRYAREAVNNGVELPLDHALRYELDLSIILQTTRDRAEGVNAFLEKRPPEFEGR